MSDCARFYDLLKSIHHHNVLLALFILIVVCNKRSFHARLNALIVPPTTVCIVSQRTHIVSPTCSLLHIVTDIDREVAELKREEAKLIREIKTTAKTGNQAAVKVLAKSLVRIRAQVCIFVVPDMQSLLCSD